MATSPADQLERIRALARAGALRITQHAHQEMVEEDITLDQLLETLQTATIVEDYPEHRRGPVLSSWWGVRRGPTAPRGMHQRWAVAHHHHCL